MTSLGVQFRCSETWNCRSRNLKCTADDPSHTKYFQYFLGGYALKSSYNEYTASNEIFREDECWRSRHVKGRDWLHIFGVQKIRKTDRRKGFQNRIFYIDCNNAKINCDRCCKENVIVMMQLSCACTEDLSKTFSRLNAELNPICHLLALLGGAI